MCGLNAIFAHHEAAPAPLEAELLATREAMTARGPDGAGAWRSGDGRVAFGHRRLAIIDPDDRAAQPMVSGCGRYVVSYNGEIYNYEALRNELLADGIALSTHSDTEVVLELIAQRGIGALAQLVGMFAVAIWDQKLRCLHLARDSYGIKPLYYADDGWTLRAASQIKALQAGGAISRDPDPAGVAGFLIWGSVPEPFTLYRQIRAIPPGHVIRTDDTGVHEAESFLTLGSVYATDEDVEPDAHVVRDAVTESVRRHLVSDVPVGLFLSAGIDSVAILAALRAIDPERASMTTAVTLGFSEYAGTAGDEAPLAKRMAARYGAQHTVRHIDEAEFVTDLPRILDAMDQPSIDGVNTWFVSKAAAESGLKVALSGVGGDELFAGYKTFREIPRWRASLAVPAWVPGAGRAWQGIMGRIAREGHAHPKLAGLLRYGASWAGVYMLRRGLYLPTELQAFLDRDFLEDGMRRLRAADAAGSIVDAAPKASVPRISFMESALYMRNQLLRDADWASMAHSLEVRTPLVDVELLRRVRPFQKRLRSKAILAEAMNLPDEIRTRPKTGFTTPVGNWMNRQIMNAEGVDAPWARGWGRFVLDRTASSGGFTLRHVQAD